jgi:hypothetical protein
MLKMLRATIAALAVAAAVGTSASAQAPGHPGAHGRWPVGCKEAMRHYRPYVQEGTRVYETALNTCFLQQIGRMECTAQSIAPRCAGDAHAPAPKVAQ